MTQRTRSRPKRSNDTGRRPLERHMFQPEPFSDDKRVCTFALMLSKAMAPVLAANRKLDLREPLSKNDKRAVMDAIKFVQPNAEDRTILAKVASDERYPRRIQEAARNKLESNASPFDRLMAAAERVRPYNE